MMPIHRHPHTHRLWGRLGLHRSSIKLGSLLTGLVGTVSWVGTSLAMPPQLTLSPSLIPSGDRVSLGQFGAPLHPPHLTPLSLPLQAIVQLKGISVPPPQTAGRAILPLQRLEQTRVYLLTVRIGEQPSAFLLDTGASTTMLATSTVQRLQLTGEAVPNDRLGFAVAGDDCPDMNATLHHLPPLQMKGVQIKGLRGLQFASAVIPAKVAGVLGMDVLRYFDLVLNPSTQELQLQPPTPLPAEDQATAVSLQAKSGVMLAPLEINGKGPFTVLLDTGADSTFISEQVATAANLEAASRQPIQIRGFCGLENAERSQLASVKLAQHQQTNLDAIILSSSILKVLGVDGILGQNFLDRYHQHWRFLQTEDLGAAVQQGSLLLNPIPPGSNSRP